VVHSFVEVQKYKKDCHCIYYSIVVTGIKRTVMTSHTIADVFLDTLNLLKGYSHADGRNWTNVFSFFKLKNKKSNLYKS
jgi:hypothetical protein